ncbi:helix-turn-helix transcriptional regulator [Aestuariimicrobium sp. Y1814]|uniref:helix-turn-helix transcriptional regulator n=1 Tax=Aestuariimicrobium sp. Y1814 TaxID=3418742 RepID=UPI003DA7A4C0
MFPDSGPTARALLALEVLQNRPGATAAQIGERLGVSERAARRSITTLRDIGVPIESERGPCGGYRLGRGLRLPPLLFSATEALGLVMAALDGTHTGGGLSEPVEQALGKLVGALPERVGHPAALMIQHARTSSSHQRVDTDPEVITAVIAAVAGHTQLELDYTTEHRHWRERVDPWAVVVRFGKWYLLCHSHRVKAVRTYRIDRISEVVDTGVTAEVPEGLDPVAEFEKNLAMGWRYPFQVTFDAPLEQVKHWIGPSMGRLSPHPDHPGRCVLVGSTSTPDAFAAEWLAEIPHDFSIDEGPELQAAMAQLVTRLAASLHPLDPPSGPDPS